jgi:hypothetical protein
MMKKLLFVALVVAMVSHDVESALFSTTFDFLCALLFAVECISHF